MSSFYCIALSSFPITPIKFRHHSTTHPGYPIPLPSMQKVMKEKSVLAERLKGAEGGRKRLTTEALSREELRVALEVEVQRLTKTKGLADQGLRDKEEQVGAQNRASLHLLPLSLFWNLCPDIFFWGPFFWDILERNFFVGFFFLETFFGFSHYFRDFVF